LKNPDADPASATPDLQARDFRKGHASYASPPPLSNGYDHHHHSPSSQDAARSLASKPDADSHIHPDLRAAAAAAAAAAASHAEAPVADMLPIAPPPGHSPGASGPSAGLVAQQPLSGGEDGAGNGRKAKRELAQSKRAAQNRAAQVRLAIHFQLMTSLHCCHEVGLRRMGVGLMRSVPPCQLFI
jgi:hypothetical protein